MRVNAQSFQHSSFCVQIAQNRVFYSTEKAATEEDLTLLRDILQELDQHANPTIILLQLSDYPVIEGEESIAAVCILKALIKQGKEKSNELLKAIREEVTNVARDLAQKELRAPFTAIAAAIGQVDADAAIELAERVIPIIREKAEQEFPAILQHWVNGGFLIIKGTADKNPEYVLTRKCVKEVVKYCERGNS